MLQTILIKALPYMLLSVTIQYCFIGIAFILSKKYGLGLSYMFYALSNIAIYMASRGI